MTRTTTHVAKQSIRPVVVAAIVATAVLAGLFATVQPSGAVVDIVSVPYLLESEIRSPIVASSYVDRIVLSGGRDQWEAFYMKPVRWMAVVFRYLSEEATIRQVGLKQSEYPFERQGSFAVPDAPELERLWEASAETLNSKASSVIVCIRNPGEPPLWSPNTTVIVSPGFSNAR